MVGIVGGGGLYGTNCSEGSYAGEIVRVGMVRKRE